MFTGGTGVKRFVRKYPLYKYLLAGTDLLALAGTYLLAEALLGNPLREAALAAVLFTPAGLVTATVCAGGALVLFQSLSLYKVNVITTVAGQTLRLVAAVTLWLLGFTLAASLGLSLVASEARGFLVAFGALAFPSLVIARTVVFRNLFLLFGRVPFLRRKVLILGAGETGRRAAVTLFLNRHIGLDVAGVLDDTLEIGTPVFGGARVIGRLDDVEKVAGNLDVAEILICLDSGDHAGLMALAERAAAMNALVKISSPLYEVVPARLMIEQYGGMPVVTVNHARPGPFVEGYKRIFDLVLASAAVVVLSPLLLAIAAAVKLDSRGPVLYRQTRVGKNGKPFTFYKFRSMEVGSDSDRTREKLLAQMIRTGDAVELAEKGTTKIVNKARVTRTGALLRRTSLDELPQLLNVLKGDMSLVGPRPCLPYEWEHYEEWHKKRLSVAPGCTGVWQVKGRSVVGFRDMVLLDLYYIQNASLPMDLKLILQTIPVMLFGRGGG